MNKIKNTSLILSLLTVFSMLFPGRAMAQEPWSAQQLVEPSELAAVLQDEDAEPPLIISVAPQGAHGIRPGKGIKGSVDYGAADEPENLQKLKASLEDLPRDTDIVLYCGCCPFDICPNIRPAFSLLNQMEFTRHRLLNIEKNIRVDWLNKGYPMNE